MSELTDKLKGLCRARNRCYQADFDARMTIRTVAETVHNSIVESAAWPSIISNGFESADLDDDTFIISLSDIDPRLNQGNILNSLSPFEKSDCFKNGGKSLKADLHESLRSAVVDALMEVGFAAGDFVVNDDLSITVFMDSICTRLSKEAG